MKRHFALLLTLLVLLSLSACGKKVNPADYDEGPDIDAGISSEIEDHIPGDPYGADEIGLSRAYDNLIIALGDYDDSIDRYVRYEYVKDVTYHDHDCYLYSRLVSKTIDGEYTHYDYVAVYKDGSMIEYYRE